MISQLYYALCLLKGAEIAKNIYPFLADLDVLPDDRDTLELIFDAYSSVEGKMTTNEMASFMNIELRERLKTFLECNLVNIESREKLRQTLDYEEKSDAHNPSNDLFCIFFQGKGYSPTVENIEALCRKINEFERTL